MLYEVITALADLAREVAARGVRLVLARLKDPVIDVLTRAAIPELPGPALVKLSVDDAVLVDDVLNDREAEPRVMRARLRGEERLEHPLPHLRRDARAVVADLEPDRNNFV